MSSRPRLLLFLLCIACTPSRATPASRSAPKSSPPPVRPDPSLPGRAGAVAREPLPAPGPSAAAPAPSASRKLAELADALPVSLVTVGATGHWLAVCVARDDSDGDGRVAVGVAPSGALTGDRLIPELLTGGGARMTLEDLFAYDPRGRWVALRHDGRNVLLDAHGGSEIDLASLAWDDRDDVLPEPHHRSLAFDPRGELLAYVRRQGARSHVVVRTLSTGAERTVGGISGEPFRMAWDGTGESLVVSAIAEDSSGNGRLDWPARAAKGPRLRCPGPLPRFAVSAEGGDRPGTFIAPRDGGPARLVTNFAVPFGANVVVRAGDGELLLDGSGSRRALAPASCGGRILHADPGRGLLLVGCPGKNPQRAAVELLGAGYRLELGVEIQPTSIDAWPEAPERLVPLYPGSDALLVDLDRRSVVRLEPGDQVIGVSGARALVRRRTTLLLLDADTGAQETLVTALPRLPPILCAGTFAVVGSDLVDLAAGELAGRISGRPLALATSGHALVARGGAPSAERLARGPLRWEGPAGDGAPRGTGTRRASGMLR